MNKNTFCLLLILILTSSGNLFSRDSNYSATTEPAKTTERNNNLTKITENRHTKEGIHIIEEMNRLRSNDVHSEGKKILELQKKLEYIEHNSITRTEDTDGLRFSDNIQQYTGQNQTDAITISQIYSTYNSYIKSIATQVEQTNPGLGTIWVAFAVGKLDSGAGATADTVLLFRSTNNGTSYNLYSRIAANPGYKVSNDEMDMEIIEHSSQKFVYLTLGFTTAGYTGLYRSTLIVYDIINNISSNLTINFPGISASSKYYRPRITSDNARYPNEAFVTFSLIQDSTDGLNHFYLTKFCRILDPYTISPAITYMPNAVYLPLIYSPFSSTVHCDVAFYNTGAVTTGDSIIFVISGYPGYTDYIFIYKARSNVMEYPHIAKILTENSHEKQFARIASNGGDDQKKMLMVFVENYVSGSFYSSSLYSYSTTDANTWTKSLILGAGLIFNIKNPDVIGQRNLQGKFYTAYKIDTPLMDFVSSSGYNDLSRISGVFNHNNTGGKSYASPKPAFRFNNSDSCLTLWSSASSLQSSCGCSSINLGFRFYIQGLYDSALNTPKYDLVTVYLRNSTAPFAKVDSAKGYSSTAFSFLNANFGTYYVSVVHRNSIETWYFQTLHVTYFGSYDLDMYSLSSKAYGSNLIKVDNSPPAFAVISGDINQDGSVNLSDVIRTFNDAATFVSGYVVTDVNGDNITNLNDVIIVYNNSTAFAHVIKP
ncbi:MAG: hypothetical protein ABI462_01000 [Ignavibacteria bacterium]